MKMLFRAAALALAVMPLCACAPALAPAIELTSVTPQQVKTLAQAEQAATIVTRAVTVYVSTAKPDKATALKIGQLSDAVHSALARLEADRRAGRCLVFDGFNAALSAFRAYQAGLR